MKHARRKSLALIACLLLALGGALAATLRSISRQRSSRPLNEINAKHPKSFDQPNSAASPTALQLVTPQAIGPIDPHVIAGGGGRSSNGNFTVDGTIGQPAAGTIMTGGAFAQAGGFGPAITSGPLATPTPSPAGTATIQFSASLLVVGEGDQHVDINVTRSGDTSGTASVGFTTSDLAGAQNCNVINGVASSRCDYETSIGAIIFAAGQTSRTVSIFIIDDSYLEGAETFTVSLSNPSGASLGSQSTASVTINDNEIANGGNPIDTAGVFVRLHYLDFLNREPDSSGFNFWTNEIASCGADQACIELKRINVSAAFYLSIEFQQTGYLVERLYKTAYGNGSGTSTLGGSHQLAVPIVRLNEFLPVNQAGWEQVLENNKQAFTAGFVQRSRFTTAFPISLTPAQFVDSLNSNAGSPLSQSERDQLVNDLATNVKTRAQALRAVAEDPDLVTGESNRAFVLMQFFGYLRRNPNDPQDTDYTGYDFWLTKLNQFNGNFVNAEMVKAFITSAEYRQRFGP